MLCLTGAESDFDAVLRRIEAFGQQMHEMRIDCLSPGSLDLARIAPHADRVLLTIRTASQGGRFSGSRDDYEQQVLDLLDRYRGLVDVEWEDAPHVGRLVAKARDRIVLSWHGSLPASAPTLSELEAIAQSMASLNVAVRKMAVSVNDAADLQLLLRLRQILPPPVVLLGLGAAGRASRSLHARFGSAWTFASLGDPVPGAPGQLSVDEARAMLPASDLPIPLGIVGGEQVSHSPGPAVYNRVFRAKALDFTYVAWPTQRLADSLTTLGHLGFQGVSVTMPHKQEALLHCTKVDDLARRVGAVNSLVPDEHGWRGFNTDVGAVRAAVRSAGGDRGLRAAVLGAGGAARAAIVALDSLGMRVDVFSRTALPANHFCTLGATVSVFPWRSLHVPDYDVIVHSTPLGSDGLQCPLAPSSDLQGRIVMDMVHTPELTPLVAMARAQRARVITGRDMWLLQAVEQVRLFVGVVVTCDELARAWPAPEARS